MLINTFSIVMYRLLSSWLLLNLSVLSLMYSWIVVSTSRGSNNMLLLIIVTWPNNGLSRCRVVLLNLMWMPLLLLLRMLPIHSMSMTSLSSCHYPVLNIHRNSYSNILVHLYALVSSMMTHHLWVLLNLRWSHHLLLVQNRNIFVILPFVDVQHLVFI